MFLKSKVAATGLCVCPLSQLAKLKRSYEKLQRKHQKENREVAKTRGDDKNEVSRLNGKIEVTPGVLEAGFRGFVL